MQYTQPPFLTWSVSDRYNPDALTKSCILRQVDAHADGQQQRRASMALGCVLIGGVVLYALLTYALPSRRCGAKSARHAKVDAQGGCVAVEDDAHLDRLIKESPKLAVMYMAEFCGHCKAMKPAYEAAAKQDRGTTYAMADCQHKVSADVARREHIRGFPTVVMYKDGARAREYEGDRSTQSLVDFCNA